MKKQKGMTLVEIVVSMAIYGLLALLLTEIMTCVNASMRATNQLNTRLSYEAKFADNQLTSGANANFSLNRHNFVINYNNGTQRINEDNRMQAFEWTTNMFDETIVGERYATDINYRFMKFAHEGADLSEYPGANYRLILRPVAYFSDDPHVLANDNVWMAARTGEAETEIAFLSEIRVTNGTLVDGSTEAALPAGDPAYTIKGQSGGAFFEASDLNQDFIMFVHNTSDVRPPTERDVSGIIGFTTMARNNLNIFDHNGVSLGRVERDTAVNIRSQPSVTYHMYVRLGESETNATFYETTVIEYNVLTGTMHALPALKQGDTIPDHPLPT